MASEMGKELEEINEQARNLASGKMNKEEVPVEAAVEEEKPSVEAASGTEEAPPAPEKPAEEPEEEIRIGDQVFKTQAEAFRWAEKQEQDRAINEAHSAGIAEALRLQAAGAAASAPVEDKFDEEFYANPKATLEKVRHQAIAEAEARIDQKITREKQWDQFLEKFPDVRRVDAERILNENMDTIGKVEITKGMEILAQKTRAYYAEIEDFRKPRTELSSKKGPQTSRSGGSPASVTPKESSERPLTFAEEMRTLKRHS